MVRRRASACRTAGKKVALAVLVSLATVTACSPAVVQIDDTAAVQEIEPEPNQDLPDPSGADSTPPPEEETPGEDDKYLYSPPQASISLACPDGPRVFQEHSPRVEFGHTYHFPYEATVFINYGDDKTYSTSKRNEIDSAFWHNYEGPGLYFVTVTLKAADGPETAASCTLLLVEDPETIELDPGAEFPYTVPNDWPPYDYGGGTDDPSSSGQGHVAACEDGTLTTSAGKQGACSWHGGLTDSDTSGNGSTYVMPYFRSDGTHVRGHWRSLPSR